jgi:hypothetical protein
MASQVLSGTGNVSYTNNTGQNVRIVINFMRSSAPGSATLGLSWAGVSVTDQSGVSAIGRNLGTIQSSGTSNNAFGTSGALPTEIMIAPGQVFSTSNTGAYNIVVIPEAG